MYWCDTSHCSARGYRTTTIRVFLCLFLCKSVGSVKPSKGDKDE
ncbi:MAG: hypothetical protein ABIL69_07460 [candidate division WOR-3 bacterium]